jgi:hypothetical protein
MLIHMHDDHVSCDDQRYLLGLILWRRTPRPVLVTALKWKDWSARVQRLSRFARAAVVRRVSSRAGEQLHV